MKKLTTYLVFTIMIGFLLFLYGFSSNRNMSKKVKNIEVEFEAGDNHFLTHKSVNKLLIQSGKTVQNQLKSSVDLHLLEATVLSNPFVEKSNVYLTLDGVLKTQIKQRKPLARVISTQETYYVDKFGAKMPLSANFSARVPLVSGIKSSEEIEELTQLVTVIAKDEFLKKEIVGIEKTETNEYTFKVRSGNYLIDFGNFSEVTVKFGKLKAFYNKMLLDNSIKKYKRINIKYHNQVVCEKRNQDGKQ